VACKMLKRKYIGYELNEEFFHIANARLKEIQ